MYMILEGLTKCQMELSPYLSQIQRHCDVVVCFSISDCGTLPPAFASVDSVADRVTQHWVVSVAYSTLNILARTTTHVFSQTTEVFRQVLAAGGVRCDAST